MVKIEVKSYADCVEVQAEDESRTSKAFRLRIGDDHDEALVGAVREA